MPPQSAGQPVAGPAPSADSVAHALYGVTPEEFTAARHEYEKQARQAGEQELAVRIHALAKPNLTAWLANQFVREHGGDLQPLFELGARLREATGLLAGDQLRLLSRQKRDLMNELLHRARQLARSAGRTVSENTMQGFADTLQAALSDEDSAQKLTCGRLTEALHPTGFGDAAVAAATIDKGSTGAPKRQPRQSLAEKQLQRAEHDLTQAARFCADAIGARDAALLQATNADHAADAAKEQVQQVQRRLEEASATASAADRLRREQATALRRAEQAVTLAKRQLADAQEGMDRLAKDASE